MVKKGRHRRYEEARQLKRSRADDDIEGLMGRLDDDPFAFLDNNNADGAESNGAETGDDGSGYEDPYADEAAYTDSGAATTDSGAEARTDDSSAAGGESADDADSVDAGSVPETD